MEAGRAAVRTFLRDLREPALAKWRRSGGHVLERPTCSAQAEAYREAYVLHLCALALDAQNSQLTERIRARNAGSVKGAGGLAARRRAKPVEHDDYSDGSDVQAKLVEANVQPSKREVVLQAGSHALAGSDGRPTKRVVADGFATPGECELVAAGVLLALAGGFIRNGQSTLGISPALAYRLASAAAAEGAQTSLAMRLLYTLVERTRRRVVAEFGVEVELYVSDAQVARLQPVDEAAAAAGVARELGALGHDPWDVGLARADHFSYWRPHIDQISVRSYDFSALLYICEFGADFGGGRLVLHDKEVDHVVLPQAGRLLLFPSGADSLHAVERVTRGSRFAMTMWFTRSKRDRQPDLEQRAWLEWARQNADHAEQPIEAGLGSAGPAAPAGLAVEPPLCTLPLCTLPLRLDTLRQAALCTLPAGDPLCHELVDATADGSVSAECVLANGVGYDPTALNDWHSLSLDPALFGKHATAVPAEEGAPSAAAARLNADKWLHPRAEACAALLMALSGGAAAVMSASTAAAADDLFGDAPSKKPRATVEDAFSIFD